MGRRWWWRRAGNGKTEADGDCGRQGNNGAPKIFGSLMACLAKSTSTNNLTL
jgi:hypothetical protein